MIKAMPLVRACFKMARPAFNRGATNHRDFASLLRIEDHYPKYVVTLKIFPLGKVKMASFTEIRQVFSTIDQGP